MDEFYAKLAQYVRFSESGEEILITRWGRPVATLGPPGKQNLSEKLLEDLGASTL